MLHRQSLTRFMESIERDRWMAACNLRAAAAAIRKCHRMKEKESKKLLNIFLSERIFLSSFQGDCVTSTLGAPHCWIENHQANHECRNKLHSTLRACSARQSVWQTERERDRESQRPSLQLFVCRLRAMHALCGTDKAKPSTTTYPPDARCDRPLHYPNIFLRKSNGGRKKRRNEQQKKFNYNLLMCISLGGAATSWHTPTRATADG